MSQQRPQRNIATEEAHQSPTNISTSTQHGSSSDANNTDSRAIDNSNVGTRQSNNRFTNPSSTSPFLQSMVQAADRIAQGPVLDLASSLRSRGSENDGDVRPMRLHQRNEPAAANQQPSHNPSRTTTARSNSPRHRTNAAVTAANSPSMPPLTRQLATDPESDREIHRNIGSSMLSDLLRQYQNEYESSTARSRNNGNAALTNSEDVARQGSRSSLSERSSEARRSLERALRDYRAARRALRSHSVENADTENSRRDATPGRLSWLREQNALVESIAALTDNNEPWQNGDEQQPLTERNNRASTTELPTTSSVPTVAALRAARLAVQRSAGPNSIAPSSSQQNVSSSTIPLNATRRAEIAERRTEHMNIIRDTLRQSEGYDLDTSHPLVSVYRTADNTDSGALPADLNVYSRRRLEASLLRNRLRYPKTEETPSRKKAKITVRYLTQLKQAAENGSSTLALAEEMGIDSIKESLENGTVSDLPLRLDELPRPMQSSWLERGVGWSGEQASSTTKLPPPVLRTPNAEIPIWAQNASRRGEETDRMLSLRARRHRERIRAERLEREQQLQDSGPVSGQDWSSFGLPLTGSIEILADMERHLSDLLEEEEQRLQSDDGWTMPESLLGRQRTRLPDPTPTIAEDRWPVSIKFHAIDLEKMTVQGTMSASHIPNRSRSALRSGSDQEDDKDASKPIESFFDGEIIDFHHNEIETREDKKGYKCGGLGIDVQYWAGLGPFREEVERQKNVIRYQKQLEIDCGGHETESGKAVLEVIKTGTRDTYESVVKSLRDCAMMDDSMLDNDENERAIDEAMIRCLGSKKWIDQKLGKEWVLMRWKERCFVTPSPNDPSSTNPQPRSSLSSTTIYSSSDPSSWGLTISGFYYIAMHRQTGKIEGLYYDPGSQPFQRLEMWPVDSGRKTTSQTSKSSSSSLATATATATATSNKEVSTGSIDQVLATGYNDDIIGVRKWFPATEFR